MARLDKSSQTSLSPDQEAAIKMLTSGCSVRYAALVLRVKPTTISAWIARDPAFKTRLKEAASFSAAGEEGGEAKPVTSVELEESEKLEYLVVE